MPAVTNQDIMDMLNAQQEQLDGLYNLVAPYAKLMKLVEPGLVEMEAHSEEITAAIKTVTETILPMVGNLAPMIGLLLPQTSPIVTKDFSPFPFMSGLNSGE